MDHEGRYAPPSDDVDSEERHDLEESAQVGRKRRTRTAPGKVTRTLSMDALPSLVREWGSERARQSRDEGVERAPASVAGVVQADGGRIAANDPFAVHLVARDGVSGAAVALPHLEAIQRAFGHHDVSGVRAHIGGAAAEAAAAIGVRAFATGDDVAFVSSPDLRQAAHEAAHVVQQRGGGVRVDGGVGARGDIYEQHADAVADLVVRGQSVEALLDAHTRRSASGAASADSLGVGAIGRALGHDFSDVDVRVGDAGGAGHDAYATFEGGRDVIAFDASSPSREQVAHELVHVAQRRRFGDGGEGIADRDAAPEVEARDLAPRIAAGDAVEVQAAPAGRIHFDTATARRIREKLDRDDDAGALRELRADRAVRSTITEYLRIHEISIWTDFQRRAPRAIVNAAMAVLRPHMNILERLDAMRGVTDDDEAGMLQVIQNATTAELQAARRTHQQQLLDFINELSPRQAYWARRRIWPEPEHQVNIVVHLLREGDGVWDDEGPAANAILRLTPSQRRQLWTQHRSAFGMYGGDDLRRIERMCVTDTGGTTTDATALEVRMRMATSGPGTDEPGVHEALAVAAQRRDEQVRLAEERRTGQTSGGRRLSQAELARRRRREAEIGNVEQLLTPQVGRGGRLRETSFLGRVQDDMDAGTLDEALATAHASTLLRAKQALLMTENEAGDVDEEAVIRIMRGIEGRDASQIRQALRRDPQLDHIFDAVGNWEWQDEERDMLVAVTAGNEYERVRLELVEAYEGIDTDETRILTILRDATPEVRARLRGRHGPQVIRDIRHWAGARTPFRRAFDRTLQTGHIPTDAALDEALGGGFDGTNVELVNEVLGGLSDQERRTLRRGYLLSRSLRSGEHAGGRLSPEDHAALVRYELVRLRLRDELGDEELDAAIAAMIGVAEVEQLGGEDSAARIDAARIMLYRQRERLEMTAGLTDAITTTDDTASAAHQEFQAAFDRALENGDLTPEEFAVLVHLDTQFNDRFRTYSETANLVSEIAGSVTAVAAATVAIVCSGGVAAGPTLAAWLSANSSVITSAAVFSAVGHVGAAEAMGGNFHDATGSDGAREALSSAISGVFMVLGSGIASHMADWVGLSGQTLSRAIASAAADSVQVSVAGRAFARGAFIGLIDGGIGGAVGDLVMTLADLQTWRQNMWGVLASAGASLLRGGLLGGVTGMTTGGLMETASALLEARSLRGVAVRMDEAGSRVRIRASVTPEGALDDISLHFGPDTTDADIAAHVERIGQLRRASTLLGRARRTLSGMRRAVDGSEAGHAFHEAEKLPQMIEDRLRQLANPELSGAERDVLESEIDMLESNLDHFARLARDGSTVPGSGSGTIARPDAPSPDYPDPPVGHYYRRRGAGWDLQRLPDGDETIQPQTLVRDGVNPNGSPRYVIRPRSEVIGSGPVTPAILRANSDIADDAFQVSDDAETAMSGIAGDRLAEIEARDTASRELAALRESLGLSEADTSSSNIDATLARLRNDPSADRALVEELERLRGGLRDARRELNRASERLGNTAAHDVMRARNAERLFGNPMPPGRPGEFDFIYVTRGANGEIDCIYVVEAKGASSTLGTAEFDGVTRSQGSRAYLEGIARSMRTNEETPLNLVLDTIIHRPPEGPRVRYILVQAPVDGNGMPLPPRVSEFDIGP